jgi:guanylate kinase
MIKKEEFAEWSVVHGNLYGTPAKRLIQITKKGYDIILDIDTQGAMQMRRRFKNAVYIFILPPSMKILEKRLKGRRSESTPEMKKRLERAKEEIAEYKNYDYIVVNDDFNKALRELESIIMSKRLGVAKVDPKWIKNLK